MSFRVVFKSRSQAHEPQPSMDFIVRGFTKNGLGGPDECNLTAAGEGNKLAQLTEYLGKPIEIYDEIGRAVWWGKVNEVRFNTGGVSIGWTLDRMANRVQVTYTEIPANSDVQAYGTVTTWTDNTLSQEIYGIYELRYSAGNSNGPAATALRDRILAERGMPVAMMADVAERTNGAALYCKGWYWGLDQRYGSIELLGAGTAPGTASFEGAVTVNQEVGSAVANTAYNRQIHLDQTINIQNVSLYLRKVGTPADNLLFDVTHHDPANGAPVNDYYTTGTIAGTSIGTAYAWMPTTLPVTVSPGSEGYGTTFILFGLNVRRSGTIDPANFYQVGVGSEGALGTHAALTPSFYDGTTWTLATAQAGTLALYRLTTENTVNSAVQATDLARRYGQGLTNVVNDAVGIAMPSYKSGDVKARQTFEELLQIGESGGNRLLCHVDVYRTMRIYEEPDSATVDYYMAKDGTFTDSSGAIVPGYLVEPGKWIKVQNIYPWLANSQLGDAGVFRAEAITWSEGGRVDITPHVGPGEYEVNPLPEVT